MSVDWSKEPGFTTCYLEDGTELYNAMQYDGRYLPSFENNFISRVTEIKENMDFRDDDILIYGYMKSGS